MGHLREEFFVENSNEVERKESSKDEVSGSLLIYSILKNRDRLLLLKK